MFVLNMGDPLRIVELADKMINLTGLTVRSAASPSGEIAIEFSSLCSSEKLFEQLLIGDNVSPTEHSSVMRADKALYHGISWLL